MPFSFCSPTFTRLTTAFVVAVAIVAPLPVSGQANTLEGGPTTAASASAGLHASMPSMKAMPAIADESAAGMIDAAAASSDEGSDHRVPGWWRAIAGQPIDPAGATLPVNIQYVLAETLANSPQVAIARHTAAIAREEIIRRDAEFDVRYLLDSTLDRQNDPVGNTLTTGGPPRLVRNALDNRIGLEKQTRQGGALDVSQSLGLLDSNSNFFLPGDQANSRLAITMDQPLLGRGGSLYATRFVAAARIDGSRQCAEARRTTQSQVIESMTAYWNLHRERCRLVQMRDLRQRTASIRRSIVTRQSWDAGGIDLAKVRFREATLDATLAESASAVVSAQMRLGRAVGSDEVLNLMAAGEALPMDVPPLQGLEAESEWPSSATRLWEGGQGEATTLVQLALSSRPEMATAAAGIEEAGLNLRISRADLRPQLNLIVGGYLAGLTGDYATGRSFANQFDRGGPGMSAGLRYAMPSGNRAARIAHRQASRQLRIADEQLRMTMQTVHAEVVASVARRDAIAVSLGRRWEALRHALQEERLMQQRFDAAVDGGSGFGLTVAALLDAHRRRTDAETAVTESATDLAIAVLNLNAACGILVGQLGSSVYPPADMATAEAVGSDDTLSSASADDAEIFGRKQNAAAAASLALRDFGPATAGNVHKSVGSRR